MASEAFCGQSKEASPLGVLKEPDQLYQTSIENAAVVGHYYRWDSGGEQAGAVEKGLALLDARAAEVLPKFEKGRALDGTEPNVVAAYLATQRARVPAMRENIQELIETIGAHGAEQALLAQDQDEIFAKALAAGQATTREEFDWLQRESIEAIRERRVKVTMEPIIELLVSDAER